MKPSDKHYEDKKSVEMERILVASGAVLSEAILRDTFTNKDTSAESLASNQRAQTILHG